MKTSIPKQLPIFRFLKLIWHSSPKWSSIYTVFLILNGIFPLFQLYIVKLIIDKIAMKLESPTDTDPMSGIMIWLIFAGLIYLVSNVLQNVEQWMRTIQTQFLADHLLEIVHKKSIDVDLQYYEDSRFHDTLHRAQQEARIRPGMLISNLSRIIRSSISLLGISVLLFTLHWAIPCVLVAASLPLVFARIKLSQKLYAWSREKTHNDRLSYYYSWLMTQIAFAKEIRLFGLGDYFIKKFSAIRSVLRKKYSSIIIRKSLVELPIQMLNTATLIAILVFIIKSNLSGKLTLGDVVMFMQATIRAISSLSGMITGVSGVMQNNLFLKNLFEFLDLEKSIIESQHSTNINTRLKEGIRFCDVSFKYPNSDRLVLDNINLKLNPGEVIGLTGLNGSGKTTLIKLLCRLYEPSDGSIQIDGTDIREIDLCNLRRNISVLFQDYGRYFFTLKENILLGGIEDSVDEDRLKSSMTIALVDNIKQRFKNGLDQTLGTWFEKGTELSFGEWQRIALARVLYQKAPIVILDEPTSSQDMESEQLISENIIRNRGDKIILIISHRKEILNIADRVLVLTNGNQISEMEI
ncbi:MAG: ABC transporter ATP-binding protein [Calditrichaeota bacterium]|nr:ABC transporter ATP-binding protein [Calditrichota bacterium]